MTCNILVKLTSPTVSANLHIWMARVHKPGGPRGLLLRGSISSATPTKGCRQMSPQASFWAWFCLYRCLLLENWMICLYQLGCWHESCQWQGTATLLVSLPSVAQLPWLVRQRFQLGEALQTIQLYRVNAIGFMRGGRSSRSVKGKS